jgi:hypothetical protein
MLALLLVLIAGPLAFALFLLRVLLASAIELQIDPQSPDVLRIRRGLILNDRTEIPRHSFGPPEIVMRQTEDGPTPMLRLPLPVRGRIIESTNFMNRAEAEGWCRAIAAALRA